MCYSALVKQNLKQLSFQFKARIDNNAFKELFEARLQGRKIMVPRALEFNFTHSPETREEKQIRDLIVEYYSQQQVKDEQELFKQQRRLTEAERALAIRPTKKASEDQRIALKKTNWYKERMEKRRSLSLTENDSQIFPFHYAPVIRAKNSELVIEPRRYHLRPQGQPESFDHKFNGCYNAREDSLEGGAFWKHLFGKNHALLIIHEFFENVSEHIYKHQHLKEGEQERNIVLRFKPRGVSEMYIPCLFDDWEGQGEDLKSFALITTDPPKEIAATGHNRCPIFLSENEISSWLHPQRKSHQELHAILSKRQTPFYDHVVAA
jgi:putative SOS response-associated peptidase YedK